MKINELLMDRQYVMQDIRCRMLFTQDIVSKDGRVEVSEGNKFKFVTCDQVAVFEVEDGNDARLAADYLSRHYICLARVTAMQEKAEDGLTGFFSCTWLFSIMSEPSARFRSY